MLCPEPPRKVRPDRAAAARGLTRSPSGSPGPRRAGRTILWPGVGPRPPHSGRNMRGLRPRDGSLGSPGQAGAERGGSRRLRALGCLSWARVGRAGRLRRPGPGRPLVAWCLPVAFPAGARTFRGGGRFRGPHQGLILFVAGRPRCCPGVAAHLSWCNALPDLAAGGPWIVS